MGMFFKSKPGSWSVSSKSDPRWDGNGGCTVVSVFTRPHEVDMYIQHKSIELNCDPPDDLEWGCWKD